MLQLLSSIVNLEDFVFSLFFHSCFVRRILLVESNNLLIIVNLRNCNIVVSLLQISMCCMGSFKRKYIECERKVWWLSILILFLFLFLADESSSLFSWRENEWDRTYVLWVHLRHVTSERQSRRQQEREWTSVFKAPSDEVENAVKYHIWYFSVLKYRKIPRYYSWYSLGYILRYFSFQGAPFSEDYPPSAWLTSGFDWSIPPAQEIVFDRRQCPPRSS